MSRMTAHSSSRQRRDTLNDMRELLSYILVDVDDCSPDAAHHLRAAILALQEDVRACEAHTAPVDIIAMPPERLQ